MKKLLLIISTLLPLLVGAQKTRTSDLSIDVLRNKSIMTDDRAYVESSPLLTNTAGYDNTAASTQNGNVAGGQVAKNITLAGFLVPPTRLMRIYSVTIKSNADVDLILNIGAGQLLPPGSTAQRSIPVSLSAKNTHSLSFRINLPERSGLFLVTGAIIPAGNFNVGFSVEADNITNDTNWGANKTLLWWGDSIWTAQGPTYVYKFCPNIVRDYLINGSGPSGRLEDVRNVVKGNGGYNSANINEMISTNQDMVQDITVGLYGLGMNDAVEYSTTPSVFQTNLIAFIARWKLKRKNVPLIIVGPSPRRDSYEASGLVPMRAWESSYVASLGDPLIVYCNGAANISTGDAANYLSGDNVHLSAQGQANMAIPIKAIIAANGFGF